MQIALINSLAKKEGFTLIELLVVTSILSLLAVTVYVALDPPKRFADARNTRRQRDVQSISTAIHQYIVDNGGNLPAGISTTEMQLGVCTSGAEEACAGVSTGPCLDLSPSLSRYLKEMPQDPQAPSEKTYYSVVRDANNIITVKACNSERSAIIEVSK